MVFISTLFIIINVAQWMPAPEGPPGCPPGLEYLTQVDQLLVNQQIELLESKTPPILYCESLY